MKLYKVIIVMDGREILVDKIDEKEKNQIEFKFTNMKEYRTVKLNMGSNREIQVNLFRVDYITFEEM